MYIDYGNHYKNSEKNLRRHYHEKNTLNMIKNHIKQCSNYIDLKKNPISKMYGFEQLKHFESEYYSFNLCKKGGRIRLIVSIDESSNTVMLEYISTKHYEDFKKRVR